MTKITHEKFREIIADLDTPDSEIAKYLMVDPEYSGAFDPRFVVDPDKVAISEEELELESAMSFGNTICRWRRQRRFKRAIRNGDTRPVLVSEGDSWFQFPFIIDETIDQLGSQYLIWSLGAAGDTAENMTGSNSEYMRGLTKWRDRVKGFLFSAAGNDVIGEDSTGKPVLEKLLKMYSPGQSAAWHIERDVLNTTLAELKAAYLKVVTTVRSDSGFTNLPIFIHGYDYVFPYPHGSGDKRDPFWAKKNAWLGTPFETKNYPANDIRREIIKILIDALYDLMNDIAARDPAGRVFVVDVRGSMPNLDDWADEIHGTSRGFKTVADRFETVISAALD